MRWNMNAALWYLQEVDPQHENYWPCPVIEAATTLSDTASSEASVLQMPISFFARRTRADLRAGPHFAAAVQAQSAFTSTSHIFSHHESNKTFHLLKVLLQMLYNGIVKLLPRVRPNQSRICEGERNMSLFLRRIKQHNLLLLGYIQAF